MQNMKKKINSNNTDGNGDENNGEVPKQKERHIVSWSQEEDDILREQIRVHGTENWAVIASKFNNKTTRQCRRRWFTYLNSDFKKGGWSPEEDLLLCEAQKIFGNRWTEIAKVVSGRTDNAVKNRFTTLCKKRAKHEALVKENKASYINLNNKRVIFLNNKRVIFPNGLNAEEASESAAPLKKMRSYILNPTDSCHQGEKLVTNYLFRHPFAVLAQNFHAGIDKIQRTFLKDDPKVLALMQQAELLSSLAIKVNSENADHSLENAWNVLQHFLKQNKDSDLLAYRVSDTDLQLESFKGLMEDLIKNEVSKPSWRQPDLYDESPASSEYSTGSSMLCHPPGENPEECQAEQCTFHQETGRELQSNQLGDQPSLADENRMCIAGTNEEKSLLSTDEMKVNNGVVGEYSNIEFSSPLQVTPLFRSLAAAIPSPKFSESEKHFLMKTFGMELPLPSPSTNPSQAPPCKRSLLHCL
ncbi:transcription factor MYB124-like isoform X2 [Olea europaea var. sylvestris]|uniref:transcription factor MYB124-like isoform X2 n=1 Tax=Olea europaea var. sylvestris TaxID=158386 RepID=UPI000C1D43C8|nr:transcription factor MYB124-like isoform X2 [Olea europaea var. sylvestris]